MENTKEKILNKALEMFAENGFDNTNLRDLAKELNISKSAIYRHYTSKEELLNSVIKQIELHYKNNMNKKIEINSLDELKTLTINQVKFTCTDKEVSNARKIIIQEQLKNKDIAKLADKHFISIPLNMYTKLFEELMNKKLIKKSDPELLALQYISPITLYVHMFDRKTKSNKTILNYVNKHIDNFIEINKK